MARKATMAAPEQILTRFRIPLTGVLKCVFAGVGDGVAQPSVIACKTEVRFRGGFVSKPYVKGALTRTIHAGRVASDFRKRLLMPPGLKIHLIVAFRYKKLAAGRLLRSMKLHRDEEVQIQMIATSAPLKDAPRKVILKRNRLFRVESPVCAHIRDDQYLACIMNIDEACYRHLRPRDLRRVELPQSSLRRSAGGVRFA